MASACEVATDVIAEFGSSVAGERTSGAAERRQSRSREFPGILVQFQSFAVHFRRITGGDGIMRTRRQEDQIGDRLRMEQILILDVMQSLMFGQAPVAGDAVIAVDALVGQTTPVQEDVTLEIRYATGRIWAFVAAPQLRATVGSATLLGCDDCVHRVAGAAAAG